MFTFEKIENKVDTWNKLQHECYSSFLTNNDWIQFQKSFGKNIDRYIILKDDAAVGLLYLEVFRRKISKYAYAPHNPLLIDSIINDSESFNEFLSDLSDFGKKYINENGLNYFKIDPLFFASKKVDIKKNGFVNSLSPGQAKDMWVIDLPETADELLRNFKKDTRYYTKRAEKLGVEITEASTVEEVAEFVAILNETKSRKGFQNFPDSYFINQWKSLNQEIDIPICRVFLAKHQGKTVAGAMINYNKDWLYYSHGGSTSDPELSKLAAPYFLHYTIMKDGIEKGFKYYSMWGVVPKGVQHDWRSMSDFKMRFPGDITEFTGPFEVHKNSFGYYLNKAYDYYIYRHDRY